MQQVAAGSIIKHDPCCKEATDKKHMLNRGLWTQCTHETAE